jgi:hypothetical protein
MAPRHASFVTGTRCPQCREHIPSEAPEGLCPSCLFAAAVTAPRDPIEGADAGDRTDTADADDEFDPLPFGFAEVADSASHRLTVLKTAAVRYLPAQSDRVLSLDAMFNRSWALNVLELALRRVRLDGVAAGGGDDFDRLKHALASESAADDQPSAGEHGQTPAGFLSAVSLLRREFHHRLREEVARTVVNPDEVDDEIWELFRALRS